MDADFWQAVIVEGIKAAAAILVAVVGVGVPILRRLRRVRDDASAGRHAAEQAREQVKNDHGTNLRDDVDDLHSDVRELRGYAKQNRESAAAAARDAAAAVQASGAVAVELRRLAEVVERLERRGLTARRRWPWS